MVIQLRAFENDEPLDKTIDFDYLLQLFITSGIVCVTVKGLSNEPRSEKTGLRGFRPGPTQTGLYSHRRWLEA